MNTRQLTPRAGLILIGIPIILWSTQAVLMKFLLAGSVGPFELNVHRSIGAILFGLFFINRKTWLPTRPLAYLPGVCLAVNFIAFNYALKTIDAYLLMVIETSSFIGSIFLERMFNSSARYSKTAIGLTLVGLGLLGLDVGQQAKNPVLIGLIFAIITAATFALFNCTLRFIESKDASLLPLMLPIAILNLPLAWSEMRNESFNLGVFLQCLILVGFVQTGIVYKLWAKASDYFSGSALCQFALLTIPLTFISEFVFLELKANRLQVAASLFLVAAVYFSIRKAPEHSL